MTRPCSCSCTTSAAARRSSSGEARWSSSTGSGSAGGRSTVVRRRASPVPSRPRRLEGYFRREWRYALDRDMNISDEKAFIIPVVVDDTKDVGWIPERFQELHATWLPQGQPTSEFVQRMRRITG